MQNIRALGRAPKIFLLADDIIISIVNPNQLLEVINEFKGVAKYKINF